MAPVVKGELNDAEQKLLDAILKGSSQEIATLLKEPGVRIDCLDKTGMTPLQHAAFKGRADVCGLLLDNGADVNSNHHENNYSTLHFAALSGNVAVTNLVLEAGAKTDLTNSVNRTAGQMAAFVGQHECVRAINNFFPKAELDKFTVPDGFEKEAKLPSTLVGPLLKLVNSTNVNPVKVALYLQSQRELVLESYKVCKVLDIIVQRAMKTREVNDVQAIKCHYFADVIRLASKSLKNSQDTLDAFVKNLAKGRDWDGFQEMQDRLIRQALKDFPYPESQLLQQLVRQIAPLKIGEGCALSTLISGMYGPTFQDESACTTCGESKAEKKCSACKCVNYCNQMCQKLHWSTHKKFCKELKEESEKREARQKAEEEEQKRKQLEMAAKTAQLALESEKRVAKQKAEEEEQKGKQVELEAKTAELAVTESPSDQPEGTPSAGGDDAKGGGGGSSQQTTNGTTGDSGENKAQLAL